jgi:hypothetical protein
MSQESEKIISGFNAYKSIFIHNQKATMSHHLDSPIARQDIRLDITDLYVFRGEVGTVFVINVCHSIAGEIPAPGYHPEGMYEIKIDLNRDAVEELTYRLTFDPRDVAGKQRYVLRRIAGAAATDPHSTGTVVCQGTTGEIVTTSSGLRVWAGRAGDPFWIEPDVLHAVGYALQDGITLNLGDWTPARAKNLFAGQTVYSMVLEVPDQDLLAEAGDSRRIGVWALSTLATDTGGWRSTNRVGLPMLPPLFTQYNEDLGEQSRADGGRPRRVHLGSAQCAHRAPEPRRTDRACYRRRHGAEFKVAFRLVSQPGS